MNRLQLATLLSWGGEAGVRGRKRLQKVVFFLQQAGCRLDCHFTLHHYGPYSRDVADACDEMAAAGLIEETIEEPFGNRQYDYTLTSKTRELLEQLRDQRLQPYQRLGRELIDEDLRRLELGSTILFFHAQRNDWRDAFERACEFKKVPPDAHASTAALDLARRVQSGAWRQ